jgi:enamine deaminase RidA (YjgF/YER057c/UK114 family)
MTFRDALLALGLELPSPANPAGNYGPYVIVGSMVYIAGQVPRRGGKVAIAGKLGRDVDLAKGQEAARICTLNALAQLDLACGGDIDRVVRCVRVTGYVNSTPDFADHPAVVNGASDLLVKVFGERGRHARTAVGVSSLPSYSACEIEKLFEIR